MFGKTLPILTCTCCIVELGHRHEVYVDVVLRILETDSGVGPENPVIQDFTKLDIQHLVTPEVQLSNAVDVGYWYIIDICNLSEMVLRLIITQT